MRERSVYMKNLIWHPVNPTVCSTTKTHSFRHTHIHSKLALACMALLALLVVPYLALIDTELRVANDTLTLAFSLRHSRAVAATHVLAEQKGVDVMKFTKDTVTNQPTDSTVGQIVQTLVTGLKPTHIAISIPMDATVDYPATGKPSPRTVESFTQVWADSIHNQNTRIIWRGTWSGIEGIYNFTPRVGSNRFPTGTASSAPTDGNTTWLGKTYAYIVDHPTYFADGDIWAPLPERTEGIFQDNTSFLPYSGAGIQANYVNFFIDLQKVSEAAFAKIGKQVKTGWTAQNFSEVKSGWLFNSLFDAAGIIPIDHYGITHTPEEMENDIRTIANQRGKQVFLQEWGDYWNVSLDPVMRQAYLDQMYAVFQKLANEGILAGFNYWGGWANNAEGILALSNNTYSINERGKLLAQFFAANPLPTNTTPPPPTGGTTEPPTNADTTPPTIQNITVLTTTNTASISWNTTEPASTQAEYGTSSTYGQSTPLDSNLLTSHSISLTNLQANTTYHYRLRSVDGAGNETITEDTIFTTSSPPQTSNRKLPRERGKKH